MRDLLGYFLTLCLFFVYIYYLLWVLAILNEYIEFGIRIPLKLPVFIHI